MKVTITLEHLERARKAMATRFARLSRSCPIAQAIGDTGLTDYSVGWTHGNKYVVSHGEYSAIPVAECANKIAVDFDAVYHQDEGHENYDLSLYPCTFELPDPN